MIEKGLQDLQRLNEHLKNRPPVENDSVIIEEFTAAEKLSFLVLFIAVLALLSAVAWMVISSL